MSKLNILNKIYAAGPLILLYYLSISEVDTNLENFLDIFSINLQIIIIYFGGNSTMSSVEFAVA